MRADVRLVAPGSGKGERGGTLTSLGCARPDQRIPVEVGEPTVGRTDDGTSLRTADDSLSRRHARFLTSLGACYLQELQGMNGTFADSVRSARPVDLEDGGGIQFGLSTVLRFSPTEETAVERAKRLDEATVRGEPTGAYGRQLLDERFQADWAFAERHGSRLSVVAVDAGQFGRVDETHSPAGGDAVLRALGAARIHRLCTEGVVARCKGEGPVLLVRDVSQRGVARLAERIDAEEQTLVIDHDRERIPVTAPVGLATHGAERESESVDALLARADAASYEPMKHTKQRRRAGTASSSRD